MEVHVKAIKMRKWSCSNQFLYLHMDSVLTIDFQYVLHTQQHTKRVRQFYSTQRGIDLRRPFVIRWTKQFIIPFIMIQSVFVYLKKLR